MIRHGFSAAMKLFWTNLAIRKRLNGGKKIYGRKPASMQNKTTTLRSPGSGWHFILYLQG
jgi:hypothetical protein